MPRHEYIPWNWYWKADDGRIYSSKKQALVAADNPDLIAWQGEIEPLAEPQIWPRDEQGNQTTAEMRKVMDVYGFTVPE